jgi:Domain of unknown function (DUF4276)
LKFLLFVEGKTEKALGDFLRAWLDSRLPKRIGIKVVRFEGWREYADEIARRVKLQVSGRTEGDVVACVGLLDLYGPTIYPPNCNTAAERYEWGKQHFEKQVDHPRFRQHFAVHETEAWLLSDPEILPREVRSALPGRSPEEVNFDEPPAKLLKHLYRAKLGRPYRKVIDGANLFQSLNPDRAAEKCPYLKMLLDDLLLLAQDRVS